MQREIWQIFRQVSVARFGTISIFVFETIGPGGQFCRAEASRILSTRSKFEKTRERWQKRTRKGCETVFPEGRRAGSRAFYLGILGLRTSRQEDRCGGSKEQGARSKEQGARNSSSRHRGGCTRTSHVHCVRANWARSMHADAQRAEATEHVQRRATCRQMLSLAAKIRACIILQPALASRLFLPPLFSSLPPSSRRGRTPDSVPTRPGPLSALSYESRYADSPHLPATTTSGSPRIYRPRCSFEC